MTIEIVEIIKIRIVTVTIMTIEVVEIIKIRIVTVTVMTTAITTDRL
jgi:hypothetical protein